MASFPPQPTGGPPPGATPQGLSSARVSPLQAQEPDAQPSGGVAKMFYEVERSLDTLAEVVPNEADSIDEIKSLLREVLARAISDGASFTDSSPTVRGPASGPQHEPMI